MRILIHFAQYHPEFRLPELEALVQLHSISFTYDKSSYSTECPFLVGEVQNEEEAKLLVSRAILVKDVYELYEKGEDYESIYRQLKLRPKSDWLPFKTSNFKFDISSFGKVLDLPTKVQLINTFNFLPFEGKIDLKTPSVTFVIFEDYSSTIGLRSSAQYHLEARTLVEGIPDKPTSIFFTRWLAKGSRRLIQQYDLKKRSYLGTTSMDAELSLIMSNMALVKPGSLVYDPFVGTGSFLVTSAHFGGFSLGSDIDGRQIRGKNRQSGFGSGSIATMVSQYALQSRVLDCVVYDISNHPLRKEVKFDAIITDPPYGVRAGAKKLGRRDGNRKLEEIKTIDGLPAHLGPNYYPPKVNYSMPQVLEDLIHFAAEYLNVGGRVVFWLPNAVEDDEVPETPKHPNLKLIADSEQPFGQWSRRLITMEKIQETVLDGVHQTMYEDPTAKFRTRYFKLEDKSLH